ncbi:MAG TPA: hypothetical protein EYQ79_00900 [Flavobacteriaceae bacterium]|jgi:hypothetical protein|nr:hypothetical protein [Flavobacteriaceae bacterium]
MRKFLILLLFIPLVSFGQTSSEAMQKLQYSKELLKMELITQKEFDSIAVALKDIILNSKIVKEEILDDGFYITNKKLIPEKFAESKTNIWGSALTIGIGGGGTKSYLIGLTSKNKLKVKNQELTLKINQNVDVAGNKISNISTQQFFSDAQSPNDFALVKLNKNIKKKERWIKTGSMSLAGGFSFQIKKKLYIDFEWEELENNTFKIKTNLEPDNYAFVFIGTSAYSNNSIFTFTVEY